MSAVWMVGFPLAIFYIVHGFGKKNEQSE